MAQTTNICEQVISPRISSWDTREEILSPRSASWEPLRLRRRDQEHHKRTVPGGLSTWDVASFIMNKVIGTGIFTTTGTILLLTGSKSVTLGMWVVGWAYAYLSAVVYIEYGVALPFTGGELIYLDDVWGTPKLLMNCIYSSFFLLLGGSTGNCLAFANFIILSFEPDKPVDHRLQKYIAVSIITLVCLVNFFSTKFGRGLNSIFSIYKIALLAAISIAGLTTLASSRGAAMGVADFEKDKKSAPENYALAFLLVVYSFSGWENANYIAGEVQGRKILPAGMLVATTLIGAFYLLVNTAFMLTCTYDELIDPKFTTIFAKRAFGNNNFSTHGYSVMIALSAVGNLISVTYTTARVKRTIALQQIMPWHKFWGSSSPFGKATASPQATEKCNGTPVTEVHTTGSPIIGIAPMGSPTLSGRTVATVVPTVGTPTGGLILTWLVSTIMIAATPIENGVISPKGYAFIISMFIYGQAFIFVMLGLGLPRLHNSERHGRFVFTDNKVVLWIVCVVYTVLSLALVVLPPIPPKNAELSKNRYPGYWLLIANGVVFFIGVVWWFGITKCLGWLGIRYNIGPYKENGTPTYTEDGTNIIDYEVKHGSVMGEKMIKFARWLRM